LNNSGPPGQPLARDHWELVKRVLADLEHIRDSWLWTMSEADLRRESVTLRRLLIDQEYVHAWRFAGFERQPLVRATSFDVYVQGIDRRWLVWGFAPPQSRILHEEDDAKALFKVTREIPAGSRLEIVPGYADGGGPLLIQIPPGEYDSEVDGAMAPPNLNAFDSLGSASAYQTWTVDDFLKSPAASLDGVTASRADIIKYCANRLGGAHGSGRKGNPAKAAVWAKLDQLYVLLPTELHAIWTELISIGRFVVNSPDVDRLRESFRRLSEPPGPFSEGK
jgi:hypothetical protein